MSVGPALNSVPLRSTGDEVYVFRQANPQAFCCS